MRNSLCSLWTELALLVATFFFLTALPAYALNFDVEYSDNRPIFPPAIWVSMSGEIKNGDTERFRKAIAPYMGDEVYEIVIRIDSPGGSLVEGMELGRAISDLPFISRISVGVEGGSQICASACVNVYLGGDYRFLSEGAQIGVHQFSTKAEMEASDAMNLSQALSAEQVAYIREMRADPAFFSLMVSANPENIYWVPRPVLEDLWVVTGSIYSESAEYRNVSGSVALFLSQTAMYGSNNMTLLCGDRGMVAVINLNEPELAGVEQIDLYIDGETVKLPDVEIISREDFRFQALSLLPMELLRRLTSAKEIGARASSPEAGIFFGFEGGVEDPKIAETAKGCLAQTRAAASPMQRLEGVDFTGGDLTQSGFRNISFSQCQQICLRNARCVAVSYVVSSQWCWPKGVIASTQRRSGIISAIRQ